MNFLKGLESKGRLHALKKQLQDDPRYEIPFKEYVQIASKFGLSEEESKKVMKHFHESTTFFHFSDNPYFKDTVILKPDIAMANIIKTVNVTALKQETEKKEEELKALEQELIKLREQKNQLDLIAQRKMNLSLAGMTVYLVAQAALVAKLTWIDYVSKLLTYINLIGMGCC